MAASANTPRKAAGGMTRPRKSYKQMLQEFNPLHCIVPLPIYRSTFTVVGKRTQYTVTVTYLGSEVTVSEKTLSKKQNEELAAKTLLKQLKETMSTTGCKIELHVTLSKGKFVYRYILPTQSKDENEKSKLEQEVTSIIDSHTADLEIPTSALPDRLLQAVRADQADVEDNDTETKEAD